MAKVRFRDVKQGKQPKRPFKKTSSKKASLPFATIKQKTKAAITDSFMLLMPIMYVVFYLIMDGREGFAQDKVLGWIYILVPFITIQTLFMYFGNGQTPGYRAYNLQVVNYKTLQKASFWAILFRNIAMLLSLVTFFGWLMMFFRKDRRGLHDLLTQTAIINISKNNNQ